MIQPLLHFLRVIQLSNLFNRLLVPFAILGAYMRDYPALLIIYLGITTFWSAANVKLSILGRKIATLSFVVGYTNKNTM